MDVLIRSARAEDTQDVLHLLAQIAEYHYNGRPDLFKKGSKYSAEQFEEMLLDAQRPVFVAQDAQGAIIGYALCKIQRICDHPVLADCDSLYIDDLCVDEQVRGLQIGRRLYEAASAFAKESGLYSVTLNVWEFNANAVRFYERCGMKTQRRTMEQIL